ncbi:MAG: PKD domain-containing protein [Acidimicrobiales bacterium]
MWRRRTAGARIIAIAAVTIVAAGTLPVTATGASTATSTVALAPITATFVQSQFATHYTVIARDTAGRPLTYLWTLKLQLVDPAGSSNPSTGSLAAVDPGCNNHGKLTSVAAQFVWQHGDASLGGCDHSKMGPSGHQGRITLVVSDGAWACTAIYNGTNTGVGTQGSCARLASTTAGSWQCQGNTLKLFDNWNGGGVLGGGRSPSFTTRGVAYCVVQLVTYHWNNSHGSKPGMIGLSGINGSSVGSWRATGSAGQGGAPNVNWTANVPTTPSPVVINGVYGCTDTNTPTWSEDAQSHGTGFCQVYVKKAVRTTGSTSTGGSYQCQGNTLKLFDNSNGGGVLGGGHSPSFTTKGLPYCVVQLITYHWNNGHGSKPGMIGLSSGGSSVGTWRASGSSGQGGAPNVNWTANVPTTPRPVVINGTYGCTDTNAPTWSQDAQTHGAGFCQVYVKKAVKSAATKGKGSSKSTTTTIKKTAKCKPNKLSLSATPDNGKPPLSVTLKICSPKTVQWRVDFGDGQSKVAIGSPPTSLTHVYKIEGDYRPRVTTISSQSLTAASSATTSVSVHRAQLISLVATPATGALPLRVDFALSTTVTHITTWSLDFGDGTRTGGAGAPPANVSHTYAKNGNFVATFSVKPGAYALVYTVASVTAGSGTPPILGVGANPISGPHPLLVVFTIGTTIPGVIVSWVMKFGDGFQTSGQGKPPASVSHTYAKKGVYVAYLLVAQQQQYGAVQYLVPRNGIVIQVG